MEANVSKVYTEFFVLLDSESGNEKHVNIDEQVLWLLHGFLEYTRGLNLKGASIAEIKYWGSNKKLEGTPVKVIY